MLVLCFFQCFDTGIQPVEMCHSPPKILPEQAEAETEGQPDNPGSLGKWSLNRERTPVSCAPSVYVANFLQTR